MFTSKRLNADAREPSVQSEAGPQSRLIIPSHNLLLAALPRIDANSIIEASKPIRLQAGDVIYEDGDEIVYAYFPIDCVISSLALLEDGSSVEISMIGREGYCRIAGTGRGWTCPPLDARFG